MRFTYSPESSASLISLTDAEEARTIELMPGAVFAFLDPSGELTAIEILNTRHFAPAGFAEADARRVIEWARERLAELAAT